jgi:hypothetical protein
MASSQETGAARDHYDPVLYRQIAGIKAFEKMSGMAVSHQDNGLGGIRTTEYAQAILHILLTARLVRIILSCRIAKCENRWCW